MCICSLCILVYEYGLEYSHFVCSWSDNMAIWQIWIEHTILFFIKLEKYFFNKKENKQIDN